jgi:hypothetical protein
MSSTSDKSQLKTVIRWTLGLWLILVMVGVTGCTLLVGAVITGGVVTS